MTWQTGAVIYMVALIVVAAVSLWAHGRTMRRREKHRRMIERYCRLEWLP